uniref:Uncharacterized protein n=1 Tax=Peronospora matthiolae TaxID=2874970 RepID=A0AAV1VI05_9STRA
MVGLGPSNQGCDSFDVCMVARETTPSAVGRESAALNVGNDVVGDSPYSVGGREGTTPNVSNDIVVDAPYSVDGREGTTLNAGNGVVGDTPYSVDGREGTTPNVGNDVIGETPLNWGLGPHIIRGVARFNPLGEVFELCNTSPDVGQDKSSRIERTMVGSNHGDNVVPTP